MDETTLYHGPVTASAPAGTNLEYDARFLEMQRLSEGVREQQYGETIVAAVPPDWAALLPLTEKLCGETRDLRVAVLRIESLTHHGGLGGMKAGFEMLEAWLSGLWDDLYPELDSSDGNDPFVRVNSLGRLCEHHRLPHLLERCVLFEIPPHARIECRDLLPPTGDATIKQFERPTAMELEAAFLAMPLATIRATYEDLHDAAGCLHRCVRILEQKTYPGIWNVQPLLGKLNAIGTAVKKYLKVRLAENDAVVSRVSSELSEPIEPSSSRASGTLPGSAGAATAANGSTSADFDFSITVASRDQAIEAIDAATNYFVRHEPSSPVPLLLRRARRLVKQDFVEILRDLAPGALAECEQFAGKDAIEGDKASFS